MNFNDSYKRCYIVRARNCLVLFNQNSFKVDDSEQTNTAQHVQHGIPFVEYLLPSVDDLRKGCGVGSISGYSDRQMFPACVASLEQWRLNKLGRILQTTFVYALVRPPRRNAREYSITCMHVLSEWHISATPWVPFSKMVEFSSQHGLVITCIIKCGMKLLTHSQTSRLPRS